MSAKVVKLPEPVHNPYFNPFYHIWVIGTHGLCLVNHTFTESEAPESQFVAGILSALCDLLETEFHDKPETIKIEAKQSVIIYQVYPSFIVASQSSRQYSNLYYIKQVLSVIAQKFHHAFSRHLADGNYPLDSSIFEKFESKITQIFSIHERTEQNTTPLIQIKHKKRGIRHVISNMFSFSK